LDSTNLNPKCARLLEIYHIACRCHCLALAGKAMEDYSAELRRIVAIIHADHSLVRRRDKLSASLANVQETSYALKTKAAPRWGTVPTLLNNHIKAADDLRAVAIKSGGVLSDRSIAASFMAGVKRHTPYLDDFEELMNFLHIDHLRISDADIGCHQFAGEVRSGHGVSGHPYEHCMMGDHVAKFLPGNKYDSK